MERPRTIPDALSCLDQRLDCLEKAIAHVSERAAPLLRPVDPSPAAGTVAGEPPPEAPPVMQILVAAERLNDYAQGLHSLAERIPT